MSASVVDSSPRRQARIAGLLYLIVMAAGMFTEYVVLGSVIVPGNAAATAGRILASEPLYRLGFAADMIDYVLYGVVMVILYGLLKPVSRNLSLLAMVFGLLGTAIVAVVSLFYFAPLLLLQGVPEPAALVLVSLRLRTIGYDVGLVFFAVHLIVLGWLVAKARFFPRILGWLLVLAGLCYLINSFAVFLVPAIHLPLYILAPAVVGEGAMALWLFVVGLNATKWHEQNQQP
jgi:hypothetical protein